MTTGAIAGSGIVGRDGELAAIALCAADAAAGRARVVWVEGEARAGKTALLRAALNALPEGFTVLRAADGELPAPRSLALTTVTRLAELRPDARALAAPAGWFIHEFTTITDIAPKIPLTAMGTPPHQCAHPESRRQPHR